MTARSIQPPPKGQLPANVFNILSMYALQSGGERLWLMILGSAVEA